MSVVRALEQDRELPRQVEGQVGIGLSLIGLIAGWLTSAVLESTVVCGAALMWFAVARVSHGRVRNAIGELTPWLGIVLPGVAVLAMTMTVGPEMAFSVWLPALLVMTSFAISILRLEWWRPIAYALLASTQHVLTWSWARSGLPAARLEHPALSVINEVMMVVWYVGVSVVCALAITGLKRALRRAERKARQHDLFGKYRIGAPIASGGMATVVSASYCPDGGFERPVAIKRIHPHLVNDALIAAFRREAEIGARLAHPNVVSVLDFGRVDDTWFIAMEHVDGTDLRRLLAALCRRRERMPPHLAGLIAYEVLQGLAFAHAGARDKDGKLLRVVHRDLSAANVLIARTGDVKISDFGIACALRDEGEHHTTHVAGSTGYMAPEQASRRVFDHRADLFAVGTILWEMLAGRRLWRRENPAASLLAILQEDAPRVAKSGVSGAWEQLLCRALAKDPEQRFESARAMADAVAAIVVAERGALPHPDELAAFLAARWPQDAGRIAEAVTVRASRSSSSTIVITEPVSGALTRPALAFH